MFKKLYFFILGGISRQICVRNADYQLMKLLLIKARKNKQKILPNDLLGFLSGIPVPSKRLDNIDDDESQSVTHTWGKLKKNCINSCKLEEPRKLSSLFPNMKMIYLYNNCWKSFLGSFKVCGLHARTTCCGSLNVCTHQRVLC